MRGTLAALAGTIALLVSLPPSALASPPQGTAYTTSEQCAGCHTAGTSPWPSTSKADFSVPALDRGDVCMKCHWMSSNMPLAQGLHHVDRSTKCGSNGTMCHAEVVADYRPDRTRIPRTAVLGGWFMSEQSRSWDGPRVHAYHSRASVPAAYTGYRGKTQNCNGCHATVACETCHEGTSVSHADHTWNPVSATRSAEATRVDVATGTPTMYGVPDYSERDITCAATDCHGFRGTSTTFLDDSVWTLGAGWGRQSLPGLPIGGGVASSVTTQAVASVNFTGDRAVLWMVPTTGYGWLLVWVDGIIYGIVDTHASDATAYTPKPLFDTGILPNGGPHTLTISTPGSIPPTLTAVYLDALQVWDYGDRAASCSTCHSERYAIHGYDSIEHTAAAAIDSGGKACTECHSLQLAVEHEKATSTSTGRGCATCHAIGAQRYSFARWGGTCQQGACHAKGSAHAQHTNYCVGCHGPGADASFASSKVDFTVAGAVNKVTACKKCHWEPTAGHPFHNPTWNCVSCHFEMGATNFAAVPKYYSATYDAYFNSAASANTDTENLHLIHANPRWPANVTKNGRQCGSCHSAANCTACHEGAIDATHEDHTWDAALGTYWPGYAPSSTKFGAGTSVGNERENSVIPALSCSNSVCHSISSGAFVPFFVEDTNVGITYSTSPSWARSSSTGYSGNSYRISNGVGAKAEYTFTGAKVEFYSDRQIYRGKAKISIDSVEVTTVDLYSAVTQKQVLAFASDPLGSGQHTITVEVTNQKNGLSRGYYVVVDCFRVFPKTGMALTKCSACHAPDDFTGSGVDRTKDHAGG
jgi:hypothetical protein